ncbi:hypothetical protein DER45DRAFT_549321 [Fusarium avenaceum]|nr:hypothetical protein DER45DRAFT_549321 [Fusarium avenaceum]
MHDTVAFLISHQFMLLLISAQLPPTISEHTLTPPKSHQLSSCATTITPTFTACTATTASKRNLNGRFVRWPFRVSPNRWVPVDTQMMARLPECRSVVSAVHQMIENGAG